MKDRAGNELAIGDKVLFLKPGTSTSWLVWGLVSGFTPKKVRVIALEGYGHEKGVERLRETRSVVKPFKE